MMRTHRISAVLIALVALCGCNQNHHDPDVQPANSTSVVTTSGADTLSPGNPLGQPISPDAGPGDVVAAFLDSLRSGDDQRAAALLTDKARSETEKENLIVQPPGTPSAKYTVGEVKYATEKRDGAHVTSIWTENGEDGVTQTYEIIWILRRLEHHGWRIAGMATQVTAGEPPLFLNFEDPKDMLSKWEEANADVNQRNQQDVRQAADIPDTTSR